MMFLPAAIAKMNEAQQQAAEEEEAASAPIAATTAAASSAPAAASSSSSSGLAPSLFLSSLSKSSVDEWLDHCAFCFREKEPHPPPRSYFATHLSQDPQADLHGIAVVRVPNPALHKPASAQQEAEEEKAEIEIKGRTAQQAAKEAAEADARKRAAAALAASPTIIASTARVFVRRCYIAGQEITVGGIGEVCTRPEFRSQGLSTLCLERCERYQRLLGMQIGSLHASKEMAAFYAARGYTSIPRAFGVKSDWETESDAAGIVGEGRKHGAFSLRLMPLAHFFAPTLLPQFMTMYAEHSKLYNGAVVRNEDYWRSWVQSNLEGSIGSSSQYPTEIYAAFEEWDGSDPAPVPASPIRFLAYMFLQRVSYDPQVEGSSSIVGGAGAGAGGKYDRVYELKEYAVSSIWGEKRGDKGRQMFLSLVTWAVRQIRHKMIGPAHKHEAQRWKLSPALLHRSAFSPSDVLTPDMAGCFRLCFSLLRSRGGCVSRCFREALRALPHPSDLSFPYRSSSGRRGERRGIHVSSAATADGCKNRGRERQAQREHTAHAAPRTDRRGIAVVESLRCQSLRAAPSQRGADGRQRATDHAETAGRRKEQSHLLEDRLVLNKVDVRIRSAVRYSSLQQTHNQLASIRDPRHFEFDRMRASR